jgi:voltage-gated potassium channel
MGAFRRIKTQVAAVIDPKAANSIPAKLFTGFIVILILLNVLAVMLGTMENFASKHNKMLQVFEVFSVIIFTVEYLLRLWICTEQDIYKSPLREDCVLSLHHFPS